MAGPLISFDEALALGRLTDHEEIGELVERAWKVRRENFGDSTDMCSLVNAKSGGCAEDCGFCAQSRYAEADTPMHAMMEPEQILEHAKAAEAAGAHRFCMVTQGQGLSKRDFDEDPRGREAGRRADQPEALRLDRPHVRGTREAGCARRGSSASTTTSSRPAPTTPRSRPRSATRAGCGRSRRSRRRAWRPASAASSTSARPRGSGSRWPSSCPSSNPTSVPINLLNPREGTKFGDRPLMDAWEVVKWVAIFRLIIPGGALPALRRAGREPRRPAAACGQGRAERGDDGQLPHHPRRRAGGRPGDVRGARA